MSGCRVGWARVRLTPDEPGSTLGWGSLGRTDAAPPTDGVDELVATALALEDARGTTVVFVNADLHAGSAITWSDVATRAGLDPAQLVLCGTHTHAGPAQRYGARMYTWFGNAAPRSAARSSERVTSLLTTVVLGAIQDLRPGGAVVERGGVAGAASNRALAAWRRNDDGDRAAFVEHGPGSASAADAPSADRYCDQRVTVLVARADDRPTTCVLAWFAVHGTSLGARWPTFSADLWGAARVAAETSAPSLVVGFGGGASGDVSPLPLDDDGSVRTDADRPGVQGRELAQVVGDRLGEVVGAVASFAVVATFELSTAHQLWEPRESSLPSPLSGMATAGGGVDGTTDRWPEVRDGVRAALYRRRSWRHHLVGSGQAPKLGIDAAYSPVPLPLGLVFRLIGPRRLPLHVVRVGGHVFATVPGEATTMAGWRIERAIIDATGATSASVVGYAGDYGGYWVTPEEYDEQLYEGASTIFGREATVALTDRLVELARRVS